MILPGEFKEIYTKPKISLAWLIVALNAVIYFVFLIIFNTSTNVKLMSEIKTESFKNSTLEMYKQTLDATEIKNINPNSDKLYAVALKDHRFFKRLETFTFFGDQVQIANNKEVLVKFYNSYLSSPQHLFGLGAAASSPWAWVTYQFVHAGIIHLLSNMLILFLIISFLEKSEDSIFIASIYLISGFAGGAAFIFFDTGLSMSVIGASSSISGLLGFLLITKNSEVMPWYFLIAPIKKGYGQIYLPVFFIFPVFFISDFVHILNEPTGVISNVAISAHVGGALMGMAIGACALLFRRKTSAHRVFSNNDGLHELP